MGTFFVPGHLLGPFQVPQNRGEPLWAFRVTRVGSMFEHSAVGIQGQHGEPRGNDGEEQGLLDFILTR